MAAHTCRDDTAWARRRVKLRRKPSSTSSALNKARKLRQQQAGGKRPGARPSPLARKRVAIRRKMESLRRLVVPPAESSGSGERLDELLLHAAGYIMRLQMQVRMMQVMVHALNNPED